MKQTRCGCLAMLLSVVAVWAAAPEGQQSAVVDLTGRWALEITMPGGVSMSRVDLRQSGNALTADYSSRSLGDHKAEGRITGDTIEIFFTFERTPGNPATTTVRLTGKIAGTDGFAGGITLTPGNTGTFIARRDAAAVGADAPLSAGAWRDPTPHRTMMIEVDRDVTLEVLEWGGVGRPLVFLAGQGNTAHVFDDFATRFTSLGQVYGITRRGYGRSSQPRQGYDADRLADDVLAVVDALHLERPILLGHSIAGEELNSFAARYPLRAGGLVYLDAVGDRTTPLPPEYTAAPALPQPSPPDRRSFATLQAWQQSNMGFLMPESELRQMFLVAPDGGVGRYKTPPWVAEAIDAGVKRPDYARMRIPALSLQSLPPASVDEARAMKSWTPGTWPDVPNVEERAVNELFSAIRKVTRTQTAAFERELKDARNVELIGASHYNFLTNADDVLREVRTFVEGLR